MLKYSKQRESILNYLVGRTDHPTAENVYIAIKQEFPNISLGTVYRNLSLLTELGEIQKISTGDGPDHFDAMVQPHLHFYCKKCACVSDLDTMAMDEFVQQATASFLGKIDGCHIQFFGVCPECTKKENN